MKIKHLLIVFILIFITAIQAWSAGVVNYDTKTGFCIWAELAIDESKYVGVPGYMIFDEKTEMTVSELKQILSTIEIKYLKKKGNPSVEEMTQAEKDIVDGKIEDDQAKAMGVQYKDRMDNDLIIQALLEELAIQLGFDPVKMKADIEQNIANKLGIPNL